MTRKWECEAMQGIRSIASAGWIASLAIFMSAQSVVADDSENGRIGPRVAEDINADPSIVEVDLTASVQTVDLGGGVQTTVWTYNGTTPGPTIQGAVGDTLVVNFVNELPEETTVHWHGVELPAAMDGSNIAQSAVEPGKSFRYQFRLLEAATYWYHSHIRSNEQVEKGLYGALVVRDREEDNRLQLPKREHVLMLDDVLLDESGQVAKPFPNDPLENAKTHVNGREGNTLLVNGHAAPTRSIQRGVPQRLRLVNVANSRFMRISIPGHTMYRIGGDGGLLQEPVEILPVEMITDPSSGQLISNPDPSQGLLLTPGERADVIFTPKGDGPVAVEWHDMPRGRHSAFFKPEGDIGLGHAHDDGKAPPKKLMSLILYGSSAGAEYTPPPILGTIDRIDEKDLTGPPILVEFGHTPPNESGDITFFAQRKNGMPLPFNAVTSADAPDVKVGETRIIEVHNLTAGDHNFHLHGFFVQPLDVRFVDLDNPANNIVVPASRLEDKDTIHIPRRPGAMMRSRTITRLLVRFDDTGRVGDVGAFGKIPGSGASGGWIFHCHILEHADSGMMSFLEVMNP